MSVYFIDLGKYVKVGYSANPERRCARLFRGATRYSKPWDCPTAPTSRRLLGYVEGDKDEEWRAHKALAEFGVGCEFFLNEPPLREYVDRCLAAGRIYRTPVKRPQGQADWVGQVEPNPEDELLLAVALGNMFKPLGGAA